MTPAEYAESLIVLLDKKKEEWNKTLPSLFKRLRNDPEELGDIQSELLSYRHMLAEESSMIGVKVSKHAKRLRLARRDKFIFYSTGVMPDGSRPNGRDASRELLVAGLKTTKGEKDLIIAGDLTDFEFAMEIMEGHQTFIRECMKSVDHALYAVKNRIELLNILMGIK